MTSDRDRAIFEAAIKLGALYHQWVGTPVSPAISPVIEQAIEKSVILQPFVEEIKVRLDRQLMTPNAFGYSEIQGPMFDVEIRTRVGTASCHARLHKAGEYPLMEIVECDEDAYISHHR